MQPAVEVRSDVVPLSAENAGASVGVATIQAEPLGEGCPGTFGGVREGVGGDAPVPEERGAHERARVGARGERAATGERQLEMLWMMSNVCVYCRLRVCAAVFFCMPCCPEM